MPREEQVSVDLVGIAWELSSLFLYMVPRRWSLQCSILGFGMFGVALERRLRTPMRTALSARTVSRTEIQAVKVQIRARTPYWMKTRAL